MVVYAGRLWLALSITSERAHIIIDEVLFFPAMLQLVCDIMLAICVFEHCPLSPGFIFIYPGGKSCAMEKRIYGYFGTVFKVGFGVI
jgi:hypothetical protein